MAIKDDPAACNEKINNTQNHVTLKDNITFQRKLTKEKTRYNHTLIPILLFIPPSTFIRK